MTKDSNIFTIRTKEDRLSLLSLLSRGYVSNLKTCAFILNENDFVIEIDKYNKKIFLNGTRPSEKYQFLSKVDIDYYENRFLRTNEDSSVCNNYGSLLALQSELFRTT